MENICGFSFLFKDRRCWLPQVKLSSHTTILSSTSRTILTQTFVLPGEHGGSGSGADHPKFKFNPECRGIPGIVPELRYIFPLYDGVSVVGFTCTINDDRTITGVVRERAEAREKFDAAVAQGQTAGLLEQDLAAGDVFCTTVGNVPAGATVVVRITYVGELKHDAEVDGLRLTIPAVIAPRYGNHGVVVGTLEGGESIEILVDAELAADSTIKSVQSPSHPISVAVGTTSTNQEPSLSRASARLALGTAALDRDFVLLVAASDLGNPSAFVETHPALPNTKTLMATLVPKFNLPPVELPEVVFICDRSGSMMGNIPDLVAALRIFLKSLPVGIRFNICSFGSRHDFLFDRSEVYSKESLDRAMKLLDGFDANYGGTEMYRPVEDAFKRRYKDLALELFVLTDGEIWAQDQLFGLINRTVEESKGAIRVFSLGVGSGASTSLVEGIARAGGGFSQMVADGEAMDRKIVRMLKGALTPHITDYKLEVKWKGEKSDDNGGDVDGDDEFELVEKVEECLRIDAEKPSETPSEMPSKASISLFDPSADIDSPISAPPAASGLPNVPLPKILQAPHAIPALFSFDRTTVYLILSGPAAQKVPCSITLRGTSPHGPVELEIPVQDTGKGETIGQLAARKAVKELEEGRGWLHHATDAGTGALLKTTYDAKFDGVVKREAVRLGVEYGVGSKWCSFVALEKGSDEEKPTEIEVVHCEGGVTAHGGLFGAPQPFITVAAMAAPPPAPMACGGGGLFGTQAAPPPPPSGGVMRSAVHRKRSSGSKKMLGMFGGPAAAAETAASDEYASRPSPPSPSSPPPTSRTRSLFGSAASKLFGSSSSSSAAPAPAALKPLFGSSSAAPESGTPVLFGSSSPAPAPSPGAPVLFGSAHPFPGDRDRRSYAPRDNLDRVIELQDFDGPWRWSAELVRILGIDAARAGQVAVGKPGSEGPEGVGDFAATCAVLAWLEKRCAERRDSWEMVAEKARGWAEGRGDVDKAVGELAKII